jgi:NAD-reducing hydrogenase small subunit
MSFLDLDEWLFDLAEQVDVVYSPLVDIKDYPEQVDVVLVEGAIANAEHLEMIRTVRDRTQLLIAFGDCAVTGNVTALRNPLGTAEPVLTRAYLDNAEVHPQIPQHPTILPPLLDRVQPVHVIVPVDLYLPGCPPSADRIRAAIEPLLAGQIPHLAGKDIKFG